MRYLHMGQNVGNHSDRFILFFTLRNDQSGVALRIPNGKRLDNAVDLLRLARKTDVHQELPQSNIQWIGLKIEL